MAATRPVHSVTNTELYDRWSKVYDTDGNILQAIDDSFFPALLTQAVSLLASSPTPITVTELGCGTGRNTVKLISPTQAELESQDVPDTYQEKELPTRLPRSRPQIAQIFACDLSSGMLSLAQKRWSAIVTSPISILPLLKSSSPPNYPDINFFEFDALNPENGVLGEIEGTADLVISTLVLEHLPLDVFFKTVRGFMREEGGVLVLTGMHAEMGRRSRAGFVDVDKSGGERKVQGSSFVYEVEEVLVEGKKWGFAVDGEVGERAVCEEDVGEDLEGSALLGKRGRKWVGCKVWFGCVMRFEGRG